MKDLIERLKAGPVVDGWADLGPTQVIMRQAAAALSTCSERIEELDGLNVTLSICNDKLARERDEALEDARAYAAVAKQQREWKEEAEARAADLAGALEKLIEHFEGDELHDEGAFDADCADCIALEAARAAHARWSEVKNSSSGGRVQAALRATEGRDFAGGGE